ncbi:hypothetical protein ACQ4PT_039455 [Festuca glaucescens]
MGWGAVVRDHHGIMQFACHEGIAGVVSPELAEAMAVRRALVVTRDKGFRDVILASDCLSVIQRIDASERDGSSVIEKLYRLSSTSTRLQTSIAQSSRLADIIFWFIANSNF